ncbi:uncharacterized protein LOC129306205 [Prosopis cineraria]|uniref:uncharacterized protein LOC129306205 n=1 Tax=Prosopis cineraria TaxID=364024 RepID=UPI0024101AD5|nr:uncharacterized protein LOC129306205 [Prosopis cineraria]
MWLFRLCSYPHQSLLWREAHLPSSLLCLPTINDKGTMMKNNDDDEEPRSKLWGHWWLVAQLCSSSFDFGSAHHSPSSSASVCRHSNAHEHRGEERVEGHFHPQKGNPNIDFAILESGGIGSSYVRWY